MEHLIEFPGILFLLATKLIKEKGRNPGISEMIDNFQDSLTPIVMNLLKSNDKERISFKVTQLLSGVITPVLIYHGTNRTAHQININNVTVRNRYINDLVDSVLF